MPPLLGVDVGFSEKRQTTGIAWRAADGSVASARAGSSWASRRDRMPTGFSAALAAIDGPLLPAGSADDIVRGCESVFQLGGFQRRCKPGMSHFGTGFALRKAAAETMAQLAAVLVAAPGAFRGPSLSPGAAVVEAFPNAFLGVMLPQELHERVGRVRRGRRFDRLYDAACAAGVLAEAASSSTLMPPGTGTRLAEERDHEKRAALLCLLTAAYAAEGTAVTVGDPSGGWFWLPPWRLWAPWARDEIARAIERVRAKGCGVELNMGA
ncbi:hypothetical protein TSO5_17160 [Azospirillum sp. TSO5]|nr:hypothetical protein TSO5_17160 [Azospirillum sp. TSO5]